LFNDDFDPFSKSNGFSSGGEYHLEMANQPISHHNDQYGDLLGDFGSGGGAHENIEDDNEQLDHGQRNGQPNNILEIEVSQ